jgi:recombination protein RecA
VSGPILSLKLPHLSGKLPLPRVIPLAEQLPPGRLIEIVSQPAGAQMTTAVACLREAQAQGEPAAWVQPEGGSLYPPDLADSGIDLEGLIVVHVPRRAGPHGLAKAAELLLRSGGFGMVVVDFVGATLRAEASAALPADVAWQGRLLGLAREHQSWLLLLSDGRRSGSLGPLVSLCIEPQRRRVERAHFAIEHRVRKDKSGTLCTLAEDHRRGPWGLL